MKKLLLTAATVALTTAASASSSFHVGAYGGYMGSATSVNTVHQNVAANTASTDLGGNGGHGGLLLGYNYAMDNGFVLGADLFGQFGSHQASHTVATAAAAAATSVNTSIKHKYAFGIAARVGYMFGDAHGYLRVGYINGRHEMTVTDAAVAASANTTNKNLNGLLLGVGVDMPVGEVFTVGLGYDFALYKNHTAFANNAGIAVANQSSAQFKPRTHAVNVVLKYKF